MSYFAVWIGLMIGAALASLTIHDFSGFGGAAIWSATALFFHWLTDGKS